MADVFDDKEVLEDIVDLSTQISNVSRRMSQGSYTMGLSSELRELINRIRDIVEYKLPLTSTVVDNNKVINTTAGDRSAGVILRVADGKLVGGVLQSSSDTIINTGVYTVDNGDKYAVVVKNHKITDIQKAP